MTAEMATSLSRLGHEPHVATLRKGRSIRMVATPERFGDWEGTAFASFRQHYILFHTLLWGDGWRQFLSQFEAAIVVCGSPYIAYPSIDNGVPVHVWSAVTMDEDLGFHRVARDPVTQHEVLVGDPVMR